MSITPWPFSGMNASSITSDAIACSIFSATPEMTMPPYEWPTSTTLLNSCHFISLTTSRMWVSTSIVGDNRCERSATPVSVGVNTSWPAPLSSRATRRQHQAPCQAPCTRTNVAIWSGPIKPHRVVDQQRLLQRRRGRDLGDVIDQDTVVRRHLLHVGVRPVGAPNDPVGEMLDERAAKRH